MLLFAVTDACRILSYLRVRQGVYYGFLDENYKNEQTHYVLTNEDIYKYSSKFDHFRNFYLVSRTVINPLLIPKPLWYFSLCSAYSLSHHSATYIL